MHSLSRSVPALCAAFIFAACSKGSSNAPPPPTACQLQTDCSGTQVCLSGVCTDTCQDQSGCTSPNVCEDGLCVKPACGNDKQCASNQACLAGACTAAPAASQVAGCSIAPAPGVVRVGSQLPLSVVAQDSAGKALHFSNFTWSASGAGATIDATGALSTASAGDATVTATVQGASASCTATVHSYAAAAAGSLRVTVINIHTKQPIAGAKVVLDTATTAQATGADGTVTYPSVTGVHNVHVFAANYGYTSFIQTSATDLLVPLTPYLNDLSLRSYFTGHMCSTRKLANGTTDPACPPEGDFSVLNVSGGGAHLAFFGSGIPNSLLDFSVNTLVGPSHQVVISLTGGGSCSSDAQCSKPQICGNGKCGYPANLPYGLVLGVTDSFFGTNDYRVFADGGLRALWGIGGNLNLSDIITLLGPALSGGSGNIDIGSLLPKLLPLFANLQAGAEVGVQAPPNALPGQTPTSTTSSIPLNSNMRIHLLPTSPDLPKLDGAYVDGVLAVAGALDYPMGFVPLGLTAGISYQVNNANGPKVLDPTCTPAGTAACATNRLPMKMAAENGGTEGSKIGVALLALNWGGITPGSTTRVAVSGQIKVMDQIDYVAPPGTALSYPAFLAMPSSSSISVGKTSRQVSITGDADPNVQLYRFELENASRLTWNIWMEKVGTGRTITLPDPSTFVTDGSLVDPFQLSPTARLLGLQLNSSQTAASLETFGSLTLDNIAGNLAAFTAVQVLVGP